MATISNLVVEIKANTKKFRRQINDATKRTQRFAKTLGKVGAGAALAGVVGITAAFIKMKNAIVDTAAELDPLLKLADNLKISAASMQKLQFQAEQSGLSFKEIETSLRTFTRTLGDANRGMKRGQDAFEELGVNMKELENLSPDQAFLRVGEALNNVESQARQASLANVLFGRNWLATLNLVRSDLEKTGEQFDEFGLGISQSQSAAIQEMNDSINRLRQYWSALWVQVTAEAAPFFTDLIMSVEAFIKKMGGIRPIAQKVASFVIGVVQSITNFILKLVNDWDRLILKIKETQLVLAKLWRLNTKLQPAFVAANVIGIRDAYKDDRRVGRIQGEIAQQREKIRRSESASAAANAALAKSRLFIEVSTDKDAVVNQIKTEGTIPVEIGKQVAREMNKQARANDR